MFNSAPLPSGNAVRQGQLSSLSQRWFVFALVTAAILAPTYNGLFAILNAHGLRASRPAAIGAELAILVLCIVGCTLSGKRDRDVGPAGLMFLSLAIGIFMSLTNDTIYPDFIRNIAIICCFTALGYRAPEREVILVFRIVSSLVLGFLILEIISLEAYVWVFQPALYLEASRGIQQFELNDTGLFANALGFRDRFNFGVFSGPRTSSLFIEQVSLPGYATVALIFVSAKWFRLAKWDRILQIALIVLIVLSNNSRTSAALLIVIAVGFYFFPMVSSRLSFLLPVFCLAAAFTIVGPVDEALGTDDLVGRLSVTVADLSQLNTYTYLFGSLERAYRSFDSGYVYILVSSTIWGCFALWAYVTLVPESQSPAQRRAHWGLAFYVYTWLLIGGTAIFTMKTSGLLWLLIGHMVYDPTMGTRKRKHPGSPKVLESNSPLEGFAPARRSGALRGRARLRR
jgi:hypothetical protein